MSKNQLIFYSNKFKAIFFYLVSNSTYLFLLSFVLKFCNQKQISLQSQIKEMNLVSPPPKISFWIYEEIVYFLPLMVFILISGTLLSYLSQKLIPLKLASDHFLLTFILTLLLILPSQEAYFSPRRSFEYSLALVSFFLAYIYLRDHFISGFKNKLRFSYNQLIFFGVLLSTLQRLQSLWIDSYELFVFDDPFTYYNTSKSFLTGPIQIPEAYNPGMFFYLYSVLQIFGEGHLFPKLIMVFWSSLGLYYLSLFIKNFFHSEDLSLIAILIYLTSSHYVEFSNQYFNENIFHPTLSIFLYQTHFLSSGKSSRKSLGHILSLLLMIGLTLMRSWFPPFGIFWYFYLLLSNKKPKNHFFKLLLIYSLILLFYIISMYSYNFYFHNKIRFLVIDAFKLNFIIGNNPYSHGTFTWHWLHFQNENHFYTDSDGYKILIRYLRDHPIFWIKLLFQKSIVWFLGAGNPRPQNNFYMQPIHFAQYFYRFLSFLLLILGSIRLLRSKKFIVFPILYLIVLGIHLLIFVEHRGVLSIMPLSTILISMGILELKQFAKNSSFFKTKITY